MSYRRIRDLREDADLTQGEMAKILHMHKTTYVRYESGEREIPFNIAISIAKHHNVSLDYIAGFTNKKRPV
jgi:DNA-binding XRE family transcriptional regulator